MRKTLPFLAVVALTGTLFCGCANVENKFGRGMRNSLEILRLGEIQNSMQNAALLDGPEVAYTTGFIHGLNKTLARTGVGIYEMVTAPIPPYDPVFTAYLSPEPAESLLYKPTLVEDSIFSTDTNLGFAGGDVAPMVPGSRFRIFDTH
jgi:putative exosortase-associated protein (TIGR04073 family)